MEKDVDEYNQEQLAGVYACLIGPRNPDPDNIPTVVTAGAGASAAAADNAAEDVAVGQQLGFGIGIGHDEGIGDDEYVVEKDVDEYNELGIIKSNINYDDNSDFASEEPSVDMTYYEDTTGTRGQNLTKGGPERPDTSGMTNASADAELKLWRKAHKKYTDGLLAAKAKLRKSLENDNDEYDDGIEYLGVTSWLLRPMSAVEAEPMCVGHSYPSKEVLLLHIAEEANLHNIEVASVRSCNNRMYFDGRGGAQFKVKAQPTLDKGWTVKEYVRWTPPTILPMGGINVGHDNDGDEHCQPSDDEEEDDEDQGNNDDFEDEDDEEGDGGDDIIGEEGNADGPPKPKRKRCQRQSPIKSKWLVPLIKACVAQRPNISNKECAHLLCLYA